PGWYSTYLYCQQRGDAKLNTEQIPDAPRIQDWAWRVVFLDPEPNTWGPRVLYGRRLRFDSIPEFLDWYSSWLDHLDARGLRSLQRHARRCDTDCESDCCMHGQGLESFPLPGAVFPQV
ncbi:hypothetical protein P175DRAFT_0427512, partial [Aspergillus ochraceoroseus IBT 24754]